MKKLLKKIFAKFPTFFYKFENQDAICNISWIIKLSKLYKFTIKIIPKYPISLFLQNYVNIIHRNIDEKKLSKEVLIYSWLENFDVMDDHSKMLFFHIIYFCNMINDITMKKLVEFANDTKNKNYRYWLTMDMSKMSFRLQSGFYDNYYIDRRELLEKIAKELCLKINKKGINKKMNRLCIVTSLLDSSVYNSTQRVAMMVADGLEKYYDAIDIVSLDVFAVSKDDCHEITTLFPFEFSIKKQRKINRMMNQKVTVHYLKKKDYKERFQEALDYIYFYNPNAIIDISDEYSALSYHYSKDFPTYYLPLRSNETSSFFNYLIGVGKQVYENSDEEYKSIEKEKVCDWIFPEYVPPKVDKFDRAEFGLLKDNFIIVTIGNNLIIDEELAQKMNQLLCENPKIVWILVGTEAPFFMHNKYQQLFESKKIIEWGFEEQLSGLCAMCDIHLRLNTTGSSGATAIASQQGLPVVMTDFVCDPMRWLGYNYSNLKNWDEVIQEILHLYHDKNYYMLRHNIILEKIETVINSEKKWEELYHILSNESKEVGD